MKKIYFPTFIFILLAFCSNSQTAYQKMLKQDTTTWQHFMFVLGVGPSEKTSAVYPSAVNNSIAALDTITIGGNLYKSLYQLSVPAHINYSNKQLMGYLREDTISRKVYYKMTYTSTEIVLYDFSLNVNDSIPLNFQNNPSITGYYRVDSIVSKTEVGGNRRHFYLRKHVNNSMPNVRYFDIIEGVGSTYHLMYPYASFIYQWSISTLPLCYHPWEVGMTCKHDDNVKQYQNCTYNTVTWNTYIDPCNYFTIMGRLKSNDWDRLIKVGPNPSNDKIEVSIEQSFESINCSVTDMAGKIIFTLPKASMSADKNSFSFSTKDLAPGIYILQVKLNETLVKRPIVVQH